MLESQTLFVGLSLINDDLRSIVRHSMLNLETANPMNDLQMLKTGAWIAATGGALFVLTWFIMARFPSKVLLGGVEGLWLRCLIRVVYAGLLVMILSVLNEMIRTALFWR